MEMSEKKGGNLQVVSLPHTHTHTFSLSLSLSLLRPSLFCLALVLVVSPEEGSVR